MLDSKDTPVNFFVSLLGISPTITITTTVGNLNVHLLQHGNVGEAFTGDREQKQAIVYSLN